MNVPPAFEILSTSDGDAPRWARLLDGLGAERKDVFYTVEYARAYERSFGTTAFLALYGQGDGYIVMPFVLRDVRLLPFAGALGLDKPVYDMASLYPFGGPIASVAESDDSRSLHVGFQRALTRFCVDTGVATQFTAFHPLLQNHRAFEDAGLVDVRRRKQVVWIDLRKTPDLIVSNMSRNHRRSIARARSLGVKAGPADWNPHSIHKFYELYRGKMRGVDADDRWELPDSHCGHLFESLGNDRVSLFNASRDGRVLLSALTVRCDNTAYHHFIGGCSEALETCAHHLLVLELAFWAKAQGCWRLHLGGGLQPDDTIFDFKAGFSRARAWFYTSAVVYDAGLYRRLSDCRDAWEKEQGITPQRTDFFPAYRR